MKGVVTIGFAGIGKMGLPMAMRLLDAGYELIVWNRDAAKLAPLLAKGAVAASKPADLSRAAGVIGICLTSHVAVEDIAFGRDGLFTPEDVRGRTFVDFSTGSIDAARGAAARAGDRGAAWVDAPVSGGVPGAEQGSLIVLAGGDARTVAALSPIFSAVSRRVTHLGPSGSGQAAKICNQMIVSSTLLVLAETIALARKAGMNVAELPGALAGGWADSLPLQIFGPRMAAHVSEPVLVDLGVMAKDVELAHALALHSGAATALLDQVNSLYSEAMERGDIGPGADVTRLAALSEAWSAPGS